MDSNQSLTIEDLSILMSVASVDISNKDWKQLKSNLSDYGSEVGSILFKNRNASKWEPKRDQADLLAFSIQRFANS